MDRSSLQSNRATVVAFALATATLGCASAPGAQSAIPSPQEAPWQSLFDGRALTAWRGYRSADLPAGWKVADGAFMKDGTTGDIVTKEQFGDFEFEFEWKMGRGGNSGVFYRATEEYDRVYWSGPEYQLLDDANAPDGQRRITSAGAVHSLYPSPAGALKPAGEWNTSRIVALGGHVEHWLNGRKLLEYENGSPDWDTKVKASKFAPWPNFGRARRGHLSIQGDHEGELWFRNVRVRPLVGTVR